MAVIPPERKLFSSYALWRKHVDPDGLVTAGDFAEMDADDKREAMREIGGAEPAPPGEARETSPLAADDEEDESHVDAPRGVGAGAGDEDEDADGGDEDDGDDEDEDDAELALGDEDDEFVELTDDVVDERSVDPFA